MQTERFVKISLIHPNAVKPARATASAAGYDLTAIAPATLYPGAVVKVPTGLRMAIPEGMHGKVCPRSGLALKGVTVANAPGIIDSDYRGEVCVLLVNLSDMTHEVKAGDRVAQLIVEQHQPVIMQEWSELDATERGEGGFGSTGT